MLPLATNVAREEGLHERSSYLISPDDLPPSEGEGALPENGMRHIDNKKTPVECEQAPDDYHYKISNAPSPLTRLVEWHTPYTRQKNIS